MFLHGFLDLSETCGHKISGRFYCEDAATNIQNLYENRVQISREDVFVPKSQVLDGKKDCSDGSDECPLSWLADDPIASRYRMIKVVQTNVRNFLLVGFSA